MFTAADSVIVGLCLEGFLYGKIFVLIYFQVTCTLAKEVQLSLALGLYSGIFAIYFQSPSKESRTAAIIFYVLCLLYILSTANLVCDFLEVIFEIYFPAVSDNSICNFRISVFLISYAA